MPRPGAYLRIDVDAFCASLNQRGYRHARPTVEAQPWGNREMSIHDPFGNRITFWSAEPEASASRPRWAP